MPNTIAENLQRLQNARTAISAAITNKGGTVPTGAGFEDFPTAINTIAGNTATITSAPPISFRFNGEPLVDWEIEGSSGGVGERTKNLLEITATSEETALNGIKFTVDKENGIIIANGQATTLRVFDVGTITNETSEPIDYYLSGGADCGAETTYFLIGTNANARLKKWNGTSDMNGSISLTNDQQMQIPAGVTGTMRIYIRNGTVCENLVFKPMVRLPHTSADFIPNGYKIPVTCGGTTTDIFIGDSPLTEGESITKAEANVDIPTLNDNNTLVVDTVAQPDSVTIQYYNYVAGIPYNTDGLCLYFASDIGRVRILPQTDHEPDVSSLNSAPYSLTEFDDTSIEVRFTMPENFTDKARLIELGNHDGMILALNLNENNIEVCANGTWAESFSTTFTGGETYTLSVTIGSGDIKIYVDGVYVEADTYTTFTVAGPIISFANGGAIGMDTRWFPTTSTISKVRVYDRVLTAAEIAANYQVDSPT